MSPPPEGPLYAASRTLLEGRLPGPDELQMKLVKEIRSQEGALHFQRWEILQVGDKTLYMHHLLRADEDRHCHDHPWDFRSLILKGGYEAMDPTGETKTFTPGSLYKMKAVGEYHRISRLLEPTWTLVLVSPRSHLWGYLTEDGWVSNERYRQLKRDGYWDRVALH